MLTTKLGSRVKEATRADLLPEFAQAAFALPESTESALFLGEARTSEGYHLIIVEQRV